MMSPLASSFHINHTTHPPPCQRPPTKAWHRRRSFCCSCPSCSHPLLFSSTRMRRRPRRRWCREIFFRWRETWLGSSRSPISISALSTPNALRISPENSVRRCGPSGQIYSSSPGTLRGDDRRYIFLGIDDTMGTGIRGPSNLFGHPTAQRIHTVESELQYWDNNPNASVTKIVFGHFPMSFTASAENGERYEPIFARQSVSAYICGHLHAKFGKHLWRLHTSGIPTTHSTELQTVKPFWEWELGDWMEFRFIRILAIDRGDVSFLDLELSSGFQTAILITHPTDSRIMNKVEDPNSQLVRNDINVLVFSIQPILDVTGRVLDSSRNFEIVEEIPLNSAMNSSKGKPLYYAKLNTKKYANASATRYWLQVVVMDSNGVQTKSLARPFSVEGKRAKFSPSWLTFWFFYLQWENVFYTLQWSNISFLILLLCLPKLLNMFMERNSSYQNWAMSVSISSLIGQRKFVFRLLWFLMEGPRIKTLWHAMVIYLIHLLTMPWFWGHATSEKGNIYKLFLSGWRTLPSIGAPASEKLGIPDQMMITLPFMYFVVAPLFLLVYCFSAERSASCFHSSKSSRCSSGCKICAGWLRKLLLAAAAAIAYMHLKIVSGIMEAYGTVPVAFSPAITWVPSLFLLAAVYSTKRHQSKAK
ncbi:putative metallophosphoesterase [Platanthera guangdongensis]|uniref:Metallophosphoesterase n=1 Tax=Platanthera guangdongensis TaxID=2320717 RepID=A0ABR2MT19_9ASPA